MNLNNDGIACSDNNACTTGDTCNGGQCQSGSPLDCKDKTICTEDTCDPAVGCVFTPALEGQGCDDGNACTDGDVCVQGKCLGTGIDCDDNNPCTDDKCDNATVGCYYVPNDNPCEDGDFCTIGDLCEAGECLSGTPFVCDDGNPCTDDSCDASTGSCKYEPNTGTCDDGDPCTYDTCVEGQCISKTLHEFPMTAFNASHIEALCCNPENVTETDGLVTGLDSAGSTSVIDGHSVSGCVGADFGWSQPIEGIVVRAAMTQKACTWSCGKYCGSTPYALIFAGNSVEDLKHLGTWTYVFTEDELKDYTLAFSEPTQIVVVCRGSRSWRRNDIIVDSIKVQFSECTNQQTEGCGSLDFDGGTNYVKVENAADLSLASGAFTVDAWIYLPDYTQNIGSIAAKAGYTPGKYGTGWSLYVTGQGYKDGVGRLGFSIYQGGDGSGHRHVTSEAYAVPLAQWTHVSATYDQIEQVVSIWIDGELSGTVSTISPPVTSYDLYLGSLFKAPCSNCHYWYGKIDEVRISSIERYEDTFTPLTYFIPDEYTVALWKLNDGTGNSAMDSSGNGHNGIITDATWSPEAPGLVCGD